MGDHGNSWTVPVFVLSSHQNDVIAGDEDPIPANGNPHPEAGHPRMLWTIILFRIMITKSKAILKMLVI
jgi:hypothetical protein